MDRAQAFIRLLENPDFSEVFLPFVIQKSEEQTIRLDDSVATEAQLRSAVANQKFAKELPDLMLEVAQEAETIIEEQKKTLDKTPPRGS